MLTTQRKSFLLDILRAEGRVVAKEAAERLALSEDTIRRDLRELAAAGKLQRVHGGALPASAALGPLSERRRIGDAGKAAIGRVAAALVQPGSVVVVDGGTTYPPCPSIAARSGRHDRHAQPRDRGRTSPTIRTSNSSWSADGSTSIRLWRLGRRLLKRSVS